MLSFFSDTYVQSGPHSSYIILLLKEKVGYSPIKLKSKKKVCILTETWNSELNRMNVRLLRKESRYNTGRYTRRTCKKQKKIKSSVRKLDVRPRVSSLKTRLRNLHQCSSIILLYSTRSIIPSLVTRGRTEHRRNQGWDPTHSSHSYLIQESNQNLFPWAN